MLLSHIERDLRRQLFWSRVFFIFPYKCHQGRLIVDKFLAIGYGLSLVYPFFFCPIHVSLEFHFRSENMVKKLQSAITVLLMISVFLMPLKRSQFSSIVDDLMRVELGLNRLNLSSEPKVSSRLSKFTALGVFCAGIYHVIISLKGLWILRYVAMYYRLSLILAGGSLISGFVSVTSHAFALLNTSTGSLQKKFPKIDVLSDIHSRAVAASRKINEVFSTYMALLFLDTFSEVTTNIYDVVQYIKTGAYLHIPVNLFWMTIFFMLSYRLIRVFKHAEEEAAKFHHTLCYHLSDGATSNSIAVLSYKLNIDRLAFTAKGFVDIHPAILLTIIASAVTYVLILIN